MLAAGGALFNSLVRRRWRGEEYLHYKLEGVPSVSYLFRGAGQNGRHADHGRITRVEIDVGGRGGGEGTSISKDISLPTFFPPITPISVDYCDLECSFFRVLFIPDFRISK